MSGYYNVKLIHGTKSNEQKLPWNDNNKDSEIGLTYV